MVLLPDTVRLVFDDGEATMRLDQLSTREFMELQDFMYGDGLPWATEEGLRRMAEEVDKHLVEWTYEGTGMDRPFQFNRTLLRAWLMEVGRVPVPLPSRAGEPESSEKPTPRRSRPRSSSTSSSEPTPATP